MPLKTEKEGALLAASKKFDQALSRYDLSACNDLLASDVVLHKDSITLFDDLHGRNAVTGYFQAYIDRYDYEHVPIAGAVDENEGEGGVAFSLSYDRGVRPKGGIYTKQHEAGQTPPGDTAAIYCHHFNKQGQIRSIYFLRQLTVDEANRKLKTVPDTSKLDFNPEKYKGQSGEQSEERAQKHQRAGSVYNQIWKTGDPSPAKEIMADNVELRNMIYGGKQTGVQSFESMIKGIFQEWSPRDHRTTVAVTAGNKAFIWWSTTGEYKGDWSNNYGLSLLVFNDQDKIAEVNTFMQPFPSQRRELLKESNQ